MEVEKPKAKPGKEGEHVDTRLGALLQLAEEQGVDVTIQIKQPDIAATKPAEQAQPRPADAKNEAQHRPNCVTSGCLGCLTLPFRLIRSLFMPQQKTRNA